MENATKTIALYGGSFNPSTKAHRAVGLFILDELKVDEVWYLVSPQNPFKTRDDMADFADRVAMARLNVEDNPRLRVKDLEAGYAASKPDGIIRSAETLERLTKDFPDHRFIFVMGADNFATFHKWGGVDYIGEHFPIVVMPREGFLKNALQSPAATAFPRVEDPRDLRWTNGWYLSEMPLMPTAATIGRDELRQGKTPANLAPEVAQYALSRSIYRPEMAWRPTP